MAKTYNNLYDEIISYSNLQVALQKTMKSKRNFVMNKDRYEFFSEKESALAELSEELRTCTWTPSEPRQFVVKMAKRREITAPQVKDRIVHHSLNNVIEELFTKKFIFHSYACVKNKGTQRAIKKVMSTQTSYLDKYDNPYVVIADVSKYFWNIRHDLLIEKFSETVTCQRTVDLYAKIISQNGTGLGLPVGALTSQLSANLYLNGIDHLFTDTYGLPYIRYMDDIVIFTKDKGTASEVLSSLGEELGGIGLKLNPKSRIEPAVRTIPFVGYRVRNNTVLPNKEILGRFRTGSKQFPELIASGQAEYVLSSVHSLLGYTKHCSAKFSTAGVLLKTLEDINKKIS